MCLNYNKYVLQLWKMSVSKEALKDHVVCEQIRRIVSSSILKLSFVGVMSFQFVVVMSVRLLPRSLITITS